MAMPIGSDSDSSVYSFWLLAALAGLRATLQDLAADGAGRHWSAFANDIVGKGKAAVTPEEIV